MKTFFLGFIGPWQIILLIIVIGLIFIFPIYLIFYKRNVASHSIPIWAKILLILPSLTWVGIPISLYICFRKKEFNGIKQYKFNRNMRFYGIVLLLISIVFTIIYYTNNNNPFQ